MYICRETEKMCARAKAFICNETFFPNIFWDSDTKINAIVRYLECPAFLESVKSAAIHYIQKSFPGKVRYREWVRYL